MLKLAIKHQIILTPVVLIIPLIGILGFYIFILSDIRQQNASVIELAKATDHIQITIATTQKLITIIDNLQTINSHKDDDEKEELLFNYAEQYGILKYSSLNDTIIDNISDNSRDFIQMNIINIEYSDNTNLDNTRDAILQLTSKFSNLYTTLHAKKRSLYIESYQDILIKTEKLTSISLFIIVLIISLGVLLTFYISRNITKRLSTLSYQAHQITIGKFISIPEPKKLTDEIDQLESYLAKMTHTLIDYVSIEKVIEGAEDERQRIAMDIHDKTLSDITHLNRYISDIKSNKDKLNIECCNYIQNSLNQLSNELRKLINNIHPQLLDTLGLESAIQSFIDNKLNKSIKYYFKYNTNINIDLSNKQQLHIYRITIELINNILQHSNADHFEMDFQKNENNILIIIEDNGVGMPSNTQFKGRGVLNIQQRAKLINAQISWKKSRFSSGTRIEILLQSKIEI